MSNLLGLGEESQNAQIEHDQTELELTVKNGANWFYWIAGLSLINQLIFMSGSGVSFLAGLGFSVVMNVFVNELMNAGGPSLVRIFAIATNLVLFAAFFFFGYYAGKQFKGAFMAGIVLYLLDAILVLFLGDYLMAGFHAFALFFIVRGYLACRKLRQRPVTVTA